MTRQIEEKRDELIERVVAQIEERLPEKEARLVTKFMHQYYLSASPDDLISRSVIDLYGSLVSHWHFIMHRKPGESKVQVYNPQYEQHGWQRVDKTARTSGKDRIESLWINPQAMKGQRRLL